MTSMLDIVVAMDFNNNDSRNVADIIVFVLPRCFGSCTLFEKVKLKVYF